MSTTIRQATLSDAATLRQIRLELVRENPKTFGILYATEKRKPLSYFENDIKHHSSPDSAIFFIDIDGQIAGMGKVGRYHKTDPTVGYLSSLGILKKHQGQGWGEKMLQYRLDWIKNQTDYKKVLLIIVDGNEKMVKLATKYGFRAISHSTFYGVPNTKYQLVS